MTKPLDKYNSTDIAQLGRMSMDTYDFGISDTEKPVFEPAWWWVAIGVFLWLGLGLFVVAVVV